MNDNRAAGFVTALLVAPLVVVCCLGRAVLGSPLGALFGWPEILGGGLAAGLVVYGLLRWRRARSCQAGRRSIRPACGIDVRAATAFETASPGFRSN